MNIEQIDEMIRELGIIGQEYDQYDYGLPTHDEAQMMLMRDVVKKYLATPVAAQEPGAITWRELRDDMADHAIAYGEGLTDSVPTTKGNKMNREQAIELARIHAKAQPQGYYAEPFQPHEWVISAILAAAGELKAPPVSYCSAIGECVCLADIGEIQDGCISWVEVTPVAAAPAAIGGAQGERQPVAWMVPHLVTFKGVAGANCPSELQPDIEGTVMWSPSLLGDAPPVVDRHGVTHKPYPLKRA